MKSFLLKITGLAAILCILGAIRSREACRKPSTAPCSVDGESRHSRHALKFALQRGFARVVDEAYGEGAMERLRKNSPGTDEYVAEDMVEKFLAEKTPVRKGTLRESAEAFARRYVGIYVTEYEETSPPSSEDYWGRYFVEMEGVSCIAGLKSHPDLPFIAVEALEDWTRGEVRRRTPRADENEKRSVFKRAEATMKKRLEDPEYRRVLCNRSRRAVQEAAKRAQDRRAIRTQTTRARPRRRPLRR